jgi:hypothetical protein
MAKLPRSEFVRLTDKDKLNTLCKKDREAWYRYYVLGQPIAEVALGLAISRASVQNALWRCKKNAMPESLLGVRAEHEPGGYQRGIIDWSVPHEEILRRAVAGRIENPPPDLPGKGRVYTEEECRLRNLEAQAEEESIARELGLRTWEMLSDGSLRIYEGFDEPPGYGTGDPGAGDPILLREEVARAG